MCQTRPRCPLELCLFSPVTSPWGTPSTEERIEAAGGKLRSPRSRGSHIADVTLKSPSHPPTRLLTLGPAAAETSAHHHSLVTVCPRSRDPSEPGRASAASAKAPASGRGFLSEQAGRRRAEPTPRGPATAAGCPGPRPRLLLRQRSSEMALSSPRCVPPLCSPVAPGPPHASRIPPADAAQAHGWRRQPPSTSLARPHS